MSLIKSRPSVWNSLDDFFDDEFFRSGLGKGESMPAVNVIDNDSSYEMEVSTPGFKKDDFKIEVENNRLTLSAESKEEKEEQEKNYTRKEFSSRSYSRSFLLPENADPDKIKADYKDGILHLTIDKSKDNEAPSRKKIEVR